MRSNKFKNSFKIEISKSVREAIKYDRYCYVFLQCANNSDPWWSRWESYLLEIFSGGIPSKVKNDKINSISNLLANASESNNLDVEFQTIIHDGMIFSDTMLGLYASDMAKVLYNVIPQLTRHEEKYGIPFTKFLYNYTNGNTDEISFGRREQIKRKLMKATKWYDFLVFNGWTKTFWYKPWLKNVCEENGVCFTEITVPMR